MSQQAAIRAEQERRIQRRNELFAAWLRRVKDWGVLTLGIVVLVMGLLAWGGAGMGAGATVAKYQQATVEEDAAAAEVEQEMESIWADTVKEAAQVDPARITGDEAMIHDLFRSVVANEDAALGKARVLGLPMERSDFGEFVAQRESRLGGFDVPGLYDLRVDLYDKVGTSNHYVATAWLIDAVTLPTGQPTADPIEPAPEHSAWVVAFVQTSADGKLQQVEAHWVSRPPLDS